jgi:hypothetical protein
MPNFNVTLTTSAATTPAIFLADRAVGSVQPPTGSSITALTIYGSNDGSTFAAVHEGGVDLPALTVAATKVTALPDVCFRYRWIKLIGDAAGAICVNLSP